MKNMTIAQALKEKNKKLSVIEKLRHRVQAFNSVEEGTTRDYDPRISLENLNREIAELVDLKVKIHEASAPIRKKIFEQSELKSQIRFLKGINTQSGIVRYGREEPYRVEALIGRIEIDNLIESMEKQIEKIQEELDAFNHTTTI
jgi:hypothetical protein